MRLLVALVFASLALLGAAAARSGPQAYSGTFSLSIKGWGRVDFKSGLGGGEPLTCADPICVLRRAQLPRARIVLVEKSYPYHTGWKFAGWRGACKGRQPKCVIKVAHIHPNASGRRNIRVGATFIPVAAGLTRAHPIPLGATGRILQSHGMRLRVNSAMQDVQLSPSPPADHEYFAANVTLTNGLPPGTGTRSAGEWPWEVVGSHDTIYALSSDGCPPSGPQPQLDLNNRLHPGESATGYVCWTIATNDASTLELYFGSRTLYDGGTSWFALH